MDYNISSVLKQLRKTSGLSANEVALRLKGYGIEISSKTLYGYESGLSMPNANLFVALCKIYKCDNPMDLFGNPAFSHDEISLMKDFKELDDEGQRIVRCMIEHEKKRTRQVRALMQDHVE